MTDNFAIAEAAPEWAAHWHEQDLWVQEATRRQLKGVGTSEWLTPEAELTKTAFYNGWLRPLMIHSMVGALVPLAPQDSVSIGIHRPQDAARFGQKDEQRLQTLIPHVQLALQLRRHLHGTQLKVQALDQALAAAQLAIVAVDAQAKLRLANRAAETLLRDEVGLTLKNGRLKARSHQEDSELQQHIRTTSLKPPGAAPASMRVGRLSAHPMTLAFLPLSVRAHELNPHGAATLVLIRRQEAQTDKAADTLRQLFGLTPAEARVTIALAQGHAPEDVAKLLSVGLGTVRTHLKSVMAKTDTNRQAQLVALVWHSVGPLPMALDEPPQT